MGRGGGPASARRLLTPSLQMTVIVPGRLERPLSPGLMSDPVPCPFGPRSIPLAVP